jgi:hypothetical protein
LNVQIFIAFLPCLNEWSDPGCWWLRTREYHISDSRTEERPGTTPFEEI